MLYKISIPIAKQQYLSLRQIAYIYGVGTKFRNSIYSTALYTIVDVQLQDNCVIVEYIDWNQKYKSKWWHLDITYVVISYLSPIPPQQKIQKPQSKSKSQLYRVLDILHIIYQ